MTASAQWQNRIVGDGEEAPDQLLANPRNWRIHPTAQQDVLHGVLRDVGWVQRVIVNQRTGHLIDGHLRVTLALRQGAASIPVEYVDLDEREEDLILATLDPLAGMAGTDSGKLDELLADVSANDAAVRAMLEEMAATASKTLLGDPGSSFPTDVALRAQVIRPVIYGADIALFERAMRAAGKRHRADSLNAICRAYLGDPDAETG